MQINLTQNSYAIIAATVANEVARAIAESTMVYVKSAETGDKAVGITAIEVAKVLKPTLYVTVVPTVMEVSCDVVSVLNL